MFPYVLLRSVSAYTTILSFQGTPQASGKKKKNYIFDAISFYTKIGYYYTYERFVCVCVCVRVCVCVCVYARARTRVRVCAYAL